MFGQPQHEQLHPFATQGHQSTLDPHATPGQQRQLHLIATQGQQWSLNPHASPGQQGQQSPLHPHASEAQQKTLRPLNVDNHYSNSSCATYQDLSGR